VSAPGVGLDPAKVSTSPAAAPAPATPAPAVNPPVSASAATATNTPAATEPPQPPPLRLQAIFLNPSRPSALINGKTLFIGSRLGDAKLVAIGQETAGQTNILSLP